MAKQNLLQTITDPIQAFADTATGGFAPTLAAALATPVRKAMGQDVTFDQVKQNYAAQVAGARERAGVAGEVADLAGIFAGGGAVLKGAGAVTKAARALPGLVKPSVAAARVAQAAGAPAATPGLLARVATGGKEFAKALPGAKTVSKIASAPFVPEAALLAGMGSAGATLANPESGLNKSLAEALPALGDALAENGVPGAIGSAAGSAASIAGNLLTAPVAAIPDAIQQFSRGLQGKPAAEVAAADAATAAAAPGSSVKLTPAQAQYRAQKAEYDKFMTGMKGMTLPGLAEALGTLGQVPTNAKPLQGTERAMQLYTNMAIDQAEAIKAQFGEDSPEYATARGNLMQQLISIKSPAAGMMLGLEAE